MQILIAENNSGFQSLYERIMKHKCYEYDFACDYSETIKLINNKQKNYDLCLFGFDLCYIEILDIIRKIRNKTKYLPIMAITGINQIREDTPFFDDLLKKPFQLNDLYSKIKKLTVKKIKIKANANKEIDIEKEMPMNKEELQELIELKKHDLTILTFQPFGHRFVVHKNTQNKISHDIVGKRKKISEFLDHNEEEPGKVHLYAGSFYSNKQIIIPEEFKKLAEIEREEMKQYPEKAEFSEDPKS